MAISLNYVACGECELSLNISTTDRTKFVALDSCGHLVHARCYEIMLSGCCKDRPRCKRCSAVADACIEVHASDEPPKVNADAMRKLQQIEVEYLLELKARVDTSDLHRRLAAMRIDLHRIRNEIAPLLPPEQDANAAARELDCSVRRRAHQQGGNSTKFMYSQQLAEKIQENMLAERKERKHLRHLQELLSQSRAAEKRLKRELKELKIRLRESNGDGGDDDRASVDAVYSELGFECGRPKNVSLATRKLYHERMVAVSSSQNNKNSNNNNSNNNNPSTPVNKDSSNNDDVESNRNHQGATPEQALRNEEESRARLSAADVTALFIAKGDAATSASSPKNSSNATQTFREFGDDFVPIAADSSSSSSSAQLASLNQVLVILDDDDAEEGAPLFVPERKLQVKNFDKSTKATKNSNPDDAIIVIDDDDGTTTTNNNNNNNAPATGREENYPIKREAITTGDGGLSSANAGRGAATMVAATPAILVPRTKLAGAARPQQIPRDELPRPQLVQLDFDTR